MSDYIKRQDVIDIIHKEIESTKTYIEHNTQINIKFAVEEFPTLDEKEIIRKPMERIIERIENARQKYQRLCKEQGEKEDEAMNIHFRGVMQIVKEEGGIQ